MDISRAKYLQELWEHAKSIPQLGSGGKSTAHDIVDIISMLEDKTCIIDIGPYMGSTTAFLSYGILKYNKDITIHAIDRWKADSEYVERARKYNNINLEHKSNFKKYFDENLKCFPNKIKSYRTHVKKFEIEKLEKISLLVDDTGGFLIKDIVDKFESKFIKGKTFVISMDYKFYTRKGNFEIAKNYFDDNPKFELYRYCKDSSKAAIFKFVA